jgi:hypothetical protein
VLDQDLSNIDFFKKNDNDNSNQKQNDYLKNNEEIKKVIHSKKQKDVNSKKIQKNAPINDPLNIR